MSGIHTAQWTFGATQAASSEACRVAEAWAVEAKFEKAMVMNLVLVVEELFTNTLKYGYSVKDGQVRISLVYQNGCAELIYADQGQPFDPSRPPENWQPDIATGKVGGIGLRLIQTKGRDIRYAREDGWNVLRLTVSDT
ncbi:MAG: ATP-binding protein [Rhodospirillaceae bacterium]|nr:ATP-binding protein [Rhodospirillaceae bacterium]